MSDIQNFHQQVSSMLLNQRIKKVTWASQGPEYTLEDDSVCSVYTYVSTADYDLSCSYIKNGTRAGFYIASDDAFGEALDDLGKGAVVLAASELEQCEGAVIEQVQTVGSGQSLNLRLSLSNGAHIEYSTSYSSPSCFVHLY